MFSVDSAKCNGCETCVTVCSQGAISLKGGGPSLTTGCAQHAASAAISAPLAPSMKSWSSL